jgi:ribA/ribD-fused uncharacterized protein
MIFITEKYYFFFQNCELSQFWKCDFTDPDDGLLRFSSAEQYMHYKKAEFFGDREAAAIILANDSPLYCKRMGRRVRGFDAAAWDKESVKVVREATRLKFESTKNLMNALMRTGDRKIVETSPYDAIWGIGMNINDPRIEDEKNWTGKNLLGEILTEFRDSRLKEEEEEEPASLEEKKKQ